eukprot:ANDGO_02872.mRNA.1 hypothetical protein
MSGLEESLVHSLPSVPLKQTALDPIPSSKSRLEAYQFRVEEQHRRRIQSYQAQVADIAKDIETRILTASSSLFERQLVRCETADSQASLSNSRKLHSSKKAVRVAEHVGQLEDACAVGKRALAYLFSLEDERKRRIANALVTLSTDLLDIGVFLQPEIRAFVSNELESQCRVTEENRRLYVKLVKRKVEDMVATDEQKERDAFELAKQARLQECDLLQRTFYYPPLSTEHGRVYSTMYIAEFARSAQSLKSELQILQSFYSPFVFRLDFSKLDRELSVLQSSFNKTMEDTNSGHRSNHSNSSTDADMAEFEWSKGNAKAMLDPLKLSEIIEHLNLRVRSLEKLAARVSDQVKFENRQYVVTCDAKRDAALAEFPAPKFALDLPKIDIDTETVDVPDYTPIVQISQAIVTEQCNMFKAALEQLILYFDKWSNSLGDQQSEWLSYLRNYHEYLRLRDDRRKTGISTDDLTVVEERPGGPLPIVAPESPGSLFPDQFSGIAASMKDYFLRVSDSFVVSETAKFVLSCEDRKRREEVEALKAKRLEQGNFEKTRKERELAAREQQRTEKRLRDAVTRVAELEARIRSFATEYADAAKEPLPNASALFALQRKMASIKESAGNLQKQVQQAKILIADANDQEAAHAVLSAAPVFASDVANSFSQTDSSFSKVSDAKSKEFAEVQKRESAYKAKQSAMRSLIAGSQHAQEQLQVMCDSSWSDIPQVESLAKTLYARGVELSVLKEPYWTSISPSQSLDQRAPKDFSKESLVQHLEVAVPAYARQVALMEFCMLRFPKTYFSTVESKMIEEVQNEDRRRAMLFDALWKESVGERRKHTQQLSPSLSNPALFPVLEKLLVAEESRRSAIVTQIQAYRTDALAFLLGFFARSAQSVCGDFKAVCQVFDNMPYVADLTSSAAEFARPENAATNVKRKNFLELLKPRLETKVPDRKAAKSTVSVSVSFSENGVPKTVKEEFASNETNAHQEAQRSAQAVLDKLRSLVEMRTGEINQRCSSCVKEEENFRIGWECTVKTIRPQA